MLQLLRTSYTFGSLLLGRSLTLFLFSNRNTTNSNKPILKKVFKKLMILENPFFKSLTRYKFPPNGRVIRDGNIPDEQSYYPRPGQIRHRNRARLNRSVNFQNYRKHSCRFQRSYLNSRVARGSHLAEKFLRIISTVHHHTASV